MNIVPELDLSPAEHLAIKHLRNTAFPEHRSDQSYYKQLPHYRALEFQDTKLIGYMGLDYRVMNANQSFWGSSIYALILISKGKVSLQQCLLVLQSMPKTKTLISSFLWLTILRFI